MDVFSLFQAKTMRLAVSFLRNSRNISARKGQYRGGLNTHYHEDADDDLVQNDDGGDDDDDDDGDYGDDENGVHYWGGLNAHSPSSDLLNGQLWAAFFPAQKGGVIFSRSSRCFPFLDI